MWERIVAGTAVVALLAVNAAEALPPPWHIETSKAKADLVLIAKVGKPEPASDMKRINRRAALEPIQALKGELPEKDEKTGKRPPIHVYYYEPPTEGENPQRHIVGIPVDPTPTQDETVMVFLRTHPRDKKFRVTCGVFGYVRLSTASDKEMAALRKRIAEFRKWGKRMQDAKLRDALGEYYDKALAAADKLAEERAKARK